ncbi:semialdehyde dehydrogenase [Hanamia caeni]|jgi:uncharacterized protein YbjT (DUF2867 family)|uniref:Semialdehyde dehydrogenase n=1 Tax=Hanamia caeni TaxID=2294116 RepID=A0A3M9NIC3_9BACT|nr:NAD(P)H-binding protein [Hanamia caeni]RNI36953.1 semialdehyde dehydrogenase [Hanamia caeni]
MKDGIAVVLGASGLTGGLLVRDLINDPDFKIVRTLGRNHLEISHPKLDQRIVNFNDKEDFKIKMGEGDVIFSCIGTTQKKVNGDKVMYEKIDHDIPVNAAAIGIRQQFKKFLIISSVGANESSSNFYLQLKGKIENSLKQFPYESISIFRPSLLNGVRKESHFKDLLAQTLMDLFSFIFLGPLRKYHAIGANTVAKAMIYESKKNKKGICYFDYEQIMDMAREYKSELEEIFQKISSNQQQSSK